MSRPIIPYHLTKSHAIKTLDWRFLPHGLMTVGENIWNLSNELIVSIILIYIYIYIYLSQPGFNPSFGNLACPAGIETRLTQTPIQDSTTQPRGNQRKRRKFKQLWITIVIVYIYPLNGYRELDSYEEPCIYANGNTFTSFARELNPTGVGEHIYIYIYIQDSSNKFQDFFRMGTFIDSTHMKL